MKEVSKRDNELDKLTTQLEKTEKKIREIDHSLHIAKTDKIQLKEGIRLREDQLKLNEINYGTTSSSLTKESAKADDAEKARKEMEHKANFVEEKIEKLEQELMTAKKTMRETHDKNDETSKRLLVKERKLEMALSNAEKSEARVRQLEADLA